MTIVATLSLSTFFDIGLMTLIEKINLQRTPDKLLRLSHFHTLDGLLHFLKIHQPSLVIIDYTALIPNCLERLNDTKNSMKDLRIITIINEPISAVDTVLIHHLSWSVLRNHNCIKGLKTLLNHSAELISYARTNYMPNDVLWLHYFDNYGLTRQEAKVLYYILLGKSNREMSDLLVLSDKTISGYRQKIYNKFGIHSLAQLYSIMNGKGHRSPELLTEKN